MQKNGKMIKCAYCGKEFYLSKGKIERSKTHFCSKECFNLYEQPHKKEDIQATYRIVVRNGKRVLEHRYIIEKSLGRKLEHNEHVHHINGNTHDNRIENLQIMTAKEHNRLHKEKLPKTKICIVCGKEFAPPIKHRGRNTICSYECWQKHIKEVSPFQNKKIEAIRNGLIVKQFESIKDAAQEVKGLSTNIVKALKGKIKSAYGYQWRYVE